MQAALLLPDDVSAAVLFYCRMVMDSHQLEQLGGPVLVFYAKHEQTWPAKMESFERTMAAAGKKCARAWLRQSCKRTLQGGRK